MDRAPEAALLIGGASRRFGSPKALAQLRGRALFQHVLAAARDAGLAPVLVGKAPPGFPAIDVPRVADDPRFAGPAAGLVAALERARGLGAPGVILLACDQPRVTPAILTHLVERSLSHPGQAAWFEIGGGIEPQPAYYPVRILDSAAAPEGAGDALPGASRPAPALNRWLRSAAGPESGLGLMPGDPRARVLHNVNTPWDLQSLDRS